MRTSLFLAAVLFGILLSACTYSTPPQQGANAGGADAQSQRQMPRSFRDAGPMYPDTGP